MKLETEIYQILRKHRLPLKKREELIIDLLDFVNKRDKAINYTHSCEKLKENTKPSFEDYKKNEFTEVGAFFARCKDGRVIEIEHLPMLYEQWVKQYL